MKTLTPEELEAQVRKFLKRYPGNVSFSNVRYAFQMSQIDRMPGCGFAGVLWSPSYGIIVYLAGSDKEWVDENEANIVTTYYNGVANAVRTLRVDEKGNPTTRKQAGRGRPKKHLTFADQ